ncbi:MAG: YeeE/YedE family protein [Alphaproteobacteria bacterium]|nr:YeeE/YedE family protein [Alphaproteobacteria bacterium]
MTEFTPIAALIGGTLIGLGAVLTMLLLGRIAGISGMLGGALFPASGDDWSWRAAFIAGMIAAPVLYTLVLGKAPQFEMPVSTLTSIIGGLLVGIGVTFGNGCASGHGVCGMARLSTRSIAATGVFMAAAVVTVYVTRHVIGG